jgi:hypothetical protein
MENEASGHESAERSGDRRRVEFQRVGGCAAIFMGVLFALVLIIFAVILPALGATDVSDLRDPTKVLPAISQQPMLAAMSLVDVAIAACLLLVALGLDERLCIPAPRLSRLARIAGIGAAAIPLVVGITSCVGLRRLGILYGEDPSAAATAYLAFHAMLEGWIMVGVVGLVCWLVLANWAGLLSGGLSKPLCYLGLLVAAGHLVRIALELPPMLDIVWFPWLGVKLIAQSQTISASV